LTWSPGLAGLVSSLFALKRAHLDVQKTIIAEPNDNPMLLAGAISSRHPRGLRLVFPHHDS
jgi:hypothetical protein